MFFGLILASGVLVGRLVDRWSAGSGTMAVIGYRHRVTGSRGSRAPPSRPATPTSSSAVMIAICAMILPGISGAYILLLLGMYLHVTGAIKGLPKGDISIDNLTTIAVFCAGCAVGLLSFSKLLRWLLARIHLDDDGPARRLHDRLAAQDLALQARSDPRDPRAEAQALREHAAWPIRLDSARWSWPSASPSRPSSWSSCWTSRRAPAATRSHSASGLSVRGLRWSALAGTIRDLARSGRSAVW